MKFKWTHGIIPVATVLIVFIVTLSQKEKDYSGTYYLFGTNVLEIQKDFDKKALLITDQTTTHGLFSGSDLYSYFGNSTIKYIFKSGGKELFEEFNGTEKQVGIKIDDPKLKLALSAYTKAKYSDAEVELFRYLQLHPKDLAVHVAYTHTLVELGKLGQARSELVQLENNPDSNITVYYSWMIPKIKYQLTGKEKSLTGENAWDDYNTYLEFIHLPNVTKETEQQIESVIHSFESLTPSQKDICNKYISSNLELINTILQSKEKPECYLSLNPNYVKAQSLAKTLVVYGRLQADNDNITEAVHAYRKTIRFGQQMSHGSFVVHFIAFSIRSMGLDGFTGLVKNTHINKLKDAQLILDTLKELRNMDPLSTMENIHQFEPPGDKDALDSTYSTALVRAHSVETKLILLETSAAVKCYKLKEGKTATDLAFLVPNYLTNLPVDTFGNNRIILKPVGQDYVLYSLGPDMGDDDGKLQYDPTNGITSNGDLMYP